MSEREWRFYLDDMLSFAENVVIYCEGLDLETFEQTGLNYDATVRNLELIGEAANNIPKQIQEQNTSVPWRQIIATRNRLIHGYLGIDNDTLWSVIQDDIPSLIIELKKIVADLNN
ncbi:nucleotidyltransferase [Methyloprofundus sedimenti]|uniref:Nucleotidyltransferase n=1 Tax=Methyloprofundus sedimenti TaxID=1420851 RepID=A0A1V8MAK0_9GAMM|nr:DUF86 domain-containing protein [Methyloprofundus sedimenti]OQK18621.1 nucleotidyltransferase [Methyloprofundus sedimenti]